MSGAEDTLEQHAARMVNDDRQKRGWLTLYPPMLPHPLESQRITSSDSPTTPASLAPPLLPSAIPRSPETSPLPPRHSTTPQPPSEATPGSETTPRGRPRPPHRPPRPKPLLDEDAYKSNLPSYYKHVTGRDPTTNPHPSMSNLEWKKYVDRNPALTDKEYFIMISQGYNIYRNLTLLDNQFERNLAECLCFYILHHTITYGVPSFNTPAQLAQLEIYWFNAVSDAHRLAHLQSHETTTSFLRKYLLIEIKLLLT